MCRLSWFPSTLAVEVRFLRILLLLESIDNIFRIIHRSIYPGILEA